MPQPRVSARGGSAFGGARVYSMTMLYGDGYWCVYVRLTASSLCWWYTVIALGVAWSRSTSVARELTRGVS